MQQTATAIFNEVRVPVRSGAAYQIALAYAYRGEMDPAFEWLERAYVQRDPGLGMMKISTPLWKMHDDPRWQPFNRSPALLSEKCRRSGRRESPR